MPDTTGWDQWDPDQIDHMLADIGHKAATLVETITWHQWNKLERLGRQEESRTIALQTLDELRGLMNRDHDAVAGKRPTA